MKRFEYFEPQTLKEAVAMLGRYNGQASILAGGTDLLVEIKEHIRQPDQVINIKKIRGMDRLAFDPKAGLTCGCLVTVREVELFPDVLRDYRGLAQAVAELGSIQIRNRATVAGKSAGPRLQRIPCRR